MIVVLDTNVVISGIFFHGPPAAVVEAWFEERFEVYATPKILEEYLRVLGEISALKAPRFEHRWEEILAEKCHLIPDVQSSAVQLRDPADVKFIDCSVQSGAKYLVSGDLDLQSYKIGRGFQIVSPRRFFELL